MVSTKEYIRREKGNDEAWTCLCGNTPTADGFYPCDENGNEVIPATGWQNLYVCGRCGRIIDQFSLEVLDQNPNFRRLD